MARARPRLRAWLRSSTQAAPEDKGHDETWHKRGTADYHASTRQPGQHEPREMASPRVSSVPCRGRLGRDRRGRAARARLRASVCCWWSHSACDPSRTPSRRTPWPAPSRSGPTVMRCHGAEGRGDGPSADNLRFQPPDLRRIAKRNRGEFPADKVRRIVDGRVPVKGHGGSEMPIFGDVLRNADVGYDSQVAELQIRAVVEYLQELAGPLTRAPSAVRWYHPPRRPRRPAWPNPRPADPLIDLRTRWRVGQALLVAAGLLTLVALARPLAASRASWLRGGDALLLAVGIFGSALLALLRGSRRPEALALYAFLVLAVDALGQLSSFPVWPLMVLLIATQAVVGEPRRRPGLRRAGERPGRGAGRLGGAARLPPGAGGGDRLRGAGRRHRPGARRREAPAEHDARRAGAGAARHRPARRRAGPLRRAGRRRRPGAAPGDGRGAPGPAARPGQRAGRDAAAAARGRAARVLCPRRSLLRRRPPAGAGAPAGRVRSRVARRRVRGAAGGGSLLVPDRARAAVLRDGFQAAALGAALVPGHGQGRVARRAARARRRVDRRRARRRQARDPGLHQQGDADPVRLRLPGRRGDSARPRVARSRGAGCRVQGRLPGVAEAGDALARTGRAPGAARLRAPDRGTRGRGDRRRRRAA